MRYDKIIPTVNKNMNDSLQFGEDSDLLNLIRIQRFHEEFEQKFNASDSLETYNINKDSETKKNILDFISKTIRSNSLPSSATESDHADIDMRLQEDIISRQQLDDQKLRFDDSLKNLPLVDECSLPLYESEGDTFILGSHFHQNSSDGSLLYIVSY